MLYREQRQRVAAAYRRPFYRGLDRIGRFHAWVKESEFRRRWFVRFTTLAIAVEIELHIKGIQHWSEARHWWEAIPLVSSAIDLVMKQ